MVIPMPKQKNMIGIIDEKINPDLLQVSYLATFSMCNSEVLMPSKFPERINDRNAEHMLQILNNMCHHPKVLNYIKSRIPTVFMPFITSDQHLPVWPLLNYLAGPSNVFRLPYNKDIIQYKKSNDGLSIIHLNKVFQFYKKQPIAKEFIEIYGEVHWDNLLNDQIITNWENDGTYYNIKAYLHPYTSYFITHDKYEKLCDDLKSICMQGEFLFGETFFTWKKDEPMDNVLVNLLKYLKNA